MRISDWSSDVCSSDLQDVTIGDVVQHAQQRQGASNLTVRNIITSMRLISDIDWADLVESVSLVDHRLRAGSNFAARSEERRVGKEWVGKGRSRWSPSN